MGFKINNNDDTITELNIEWNRKILFLPVEVADSFPNLKMYSVRQCAIKKITRENFANLRKLLWLYFFSIPIETIYDDTFEDLVMLEGLGLSMIKRSVTRCFNAF